jgi:DNA-binding Lrp family transcriptional regulator
MPTLDDIDMEILGMLADDARRPYREIADAVDRSPPTVSDRIDRLQKVGVIERFTVDVDRSTIQDGVSVLVDADIAPEAVEDASRALADAPAVEYVFTTTDARIVFYASLPDGDVRGLFADVLDFDRVRDYDVSLLEDVTWSPDVTGTGFALDCAECGNTVTDEGESVRIDGDRYQFCCSSCRSNFEERYAELEEAADD